EYFFESFNTEPEAQLHLDTSDGAIIIYVRQGLPSGAQNLPVGGIRSLAPVFRDAGEPGQTVLAFLGTGDVFVQGSWEGTIVAPGGDIKLERPSNPGLPGPAPGHVGAFFGRSVEIAGGQHAVRHVPFDWSNVLTPPILTMVPSPVGLISYVETYTGQQHPAVTRLNEPTKFELPEFLEATFGNAGQGTTTLSFEKVPSAEVVTCTYRGGAPVP